VNSVAAAVASLIEVVFILFVLFAFADPPAKERPVAFLRAVHDCGAKREVTFGNRGDPHCCNA
jgi:hypothetical protein